MSDAPDPKPNNIKRGKSVISTLSRTANNQQKQAINNFLKEYPLFLFAIYAQDFATAKQVITQAEKSGHLSVETRDWIRSVVDH